ncbi:MAG: AMP-binding protein, partial [Candidatus Melainabacteria bacterium]|nr:AMP-binding protein [Candidatus Melainabacteria bacterium]
MTSSLAHIFSPDDRSNTAIVVPQSGISRSYGELVADIQRLANQIKRAGIGRGDFVAIVLPNGLEFVVTFFAVTFSRAIAAPMNPALTVDELRSGIQRLGARAVIVASDCKPAWQVAQELNIPVWEADLDSDGIVQLAGVLNVPGLRPADACPESGDVALFLYTSGTTSLPKGVPLTHGNLLAAAHSFSSCFRLTSEDATVVVMPLFHV